MKECSAQLRMNGEAYPPYCARCGLGPCIAWPAGLPAAQPVARIVNVTDIADAGNLLQSVCHTRSRDAGWWHDKQGHHLLDGQHAQFVIGTKLMLTVTELAEGMEGARKNLMDDKLPHRPMLEVELADALIRICDLAGAMGYDLGGAIAEKLAFNSTRPDHKKGSARKSRR